MNQIQKYWKDPVISKIISFLIIALLTTLFNIIKSFYSKTNFLTEIVDFWNFEIPLWFVSLLLLTIFLISLIKKHSDHTSIFVYDEKTQKLDIYLFNRIRHEIFSEKNIEDLKWNRFGSHPFNVDDVDFLDEITQADDNPNFEFLNPELENLKIELIRSIEDLKDTLGKYIFGTSIKHPTITFIGIPVEWDYDRKHNAQIEIENMSNTVFIKYESLIKKGRRKLKV